MKYMRPSSLTPTVSPSVTIGSSANSLFDSSADAILNFWLGSNEANTICLLSQAKMTVTSILWHHPRKTFRRIGNGCSIAVALTVCHGCGVTSSQVICARSTSDGDVVAACLAVAHAVASSRRSTISLAAITVSWLSYPRTGCAHRCGCRMDCKSGGRSGSEAHPRLQAATQVHTLCRAVNFATVRCCMCTVKLLSAR